MRPDFHPDDRCISGALPRVIGVQRVACFVTCVWIRGKRHLILLSVDEFYNSRVLCKHRSSNAAWLRSSFILLNHLIVVSLCGGISFTTVHVLASVWRPVFVYHNWVQFQNIRISGFKIISFCPLCFECLDLN